MHGDAQISGQLRVAIFLLWRKKLRRTIPLCLPTMTNVRLVTMIFLVLCLYFYWLVVSWHVSFIKHCPLHKHPLKNFSILHNWKNELLKCRSNTSSWGGHWAHSHGWTSFHRRYTASATSRNTATPLDSAIQDYHVNLCSSDLVCLAVHLRRYLS